MGADAGRGNSASPEPREKPGERGGFGLEESRTCGMVSRVNWVETVLALTSRGYFWQERPQGLYCGQVCGTQVCPEVHP